MKRKLNWHWLFSFLFIGILCFMPTDTAKSDISYLYKFNEKEQAYYIDRIYATEQDELFDLPSRYKGYPVVGICKGAISSTTKTYIKKLVIPSSYAKFESDFSSCENLEEVVIHAELTSINPYFFFGCKKLKQFDIPKSV